jgi:hypothetical protein
MAAGAQALAAKIQSRFGFRAENPFYFFTNRRRFFVLV